MLYAKSFVIRGAIYVGQVYFFQNTVYTCTFSVKSAISWAFSDRDLSLSTVVPRRPSTTTTTSGPLTYPPSSPGAAEGGVDVTPSAGGATPVSVGRATRGTPYVDVIQVKGQRNQCCDNVIYLLYHLLHLLIKHIKESLENYLSICCINYLVFLHQKCIWKNIKLVR